MPPLRSLSAPAPAPSAPSAPSASFARVAGVARVALVACVLACVPALSGCDVFLALILSPFFPGKPQPPPDDLTCPLALGDASAVPPEPTSFAPAPPAIDGSCDVGTKTLQRLNRFELDNTFRDLTGQDLQLAATNFPADDFADGFDNNADVLAMSPLLVEKLEGAAETVVATAMQRPGEVSETHTFEAETVGVGTGGPPDANATVYDIGRGGEVSVQAIVPNAAGVYAVRVRAGAKDGAQDPRIELVVDGNSLFISDVKGTDKAPELFETKATLSIGPVHTLEARFAPSTKVKGGGGGTLAVDFFEVEGPLVVTELGPDPPARKRIVTCDLAKGGLACADDVVAGFARRAWRRPIADAEKARLHEFLFEDMRDGDTLEDALRATLESVLLSPHFLFRVESDPASDLVSSAPQPHVLDDHELAARLSYFLWSSTPDDRLLDLADKGALNDPAVLEEEAKRMLDDPKSVALVKSFAGQWLFTRAVDSVTPDAIIFPEFDETLRSAMECETELTFDRYLRDDSLSMLDLVTDDSTFVNKRLAKHYGVEPPKAATLGHGWGLVSTKGTERAGILGNASLLTVTSQPNRTSPTKRGKWILDNLLCESPPDPPPGVTGLPTPPPTGPTESMRDQMQQHVADPFCASCHTTIDPFGFGLEHFDGIGRWRASDNGFAIDDSALYMGDENAPFHGPRELAQKIHDDPSLPQCISQKTLTYALGKGTDDVAFACNLRDIEQKFQAGGYKMSDLIVAIVESPSFRMRRAEGAVTP